jgi:hypothetical protein
LQRTYRIGIRLIIAIVAYYFIALKLGSVGILNISKAEFGSLSSQNILWFGFVIVLMPFVWALEAYKWRFSLSEFTNISFWRSWRSVWYGLVAGQLTPNRIGEPIGRLALIDSDVRGKASIAAVWCSFSQQLTTIIFGLISIFWWLGFKRFSVLPSTIPFWLVILTIICWVGLMIFGIIKIRKIARWLEGFDWMKRILSGESLYCDFRASSFFFVLSISILRYVLFSSQYVILLRVFGVSASVIDLYAVVGLTYLLSSFIPSFFLTEVGIKAGLAIYFAGMISDNVFGVTAASLILWILNLAMPALIAAWFPWRIHGLTSVKENKILVKQ